MADHEPRRSVRSTKGQHKALEQLGQPVEAKRRGRKAGRKLEDKQDDSEEEVIRCVCGATEQDGDPSEPWIACDRCGAWQHNVCMGMSVYGEDLAKEDYFCEQCKPENHKELLMGIARGEKPWEERRRIHEEEKANRKRKGGRKPKAKRNSDAREDSAKPSPPPQTKKEAKSVAGAKRKSRSGSEDQDVKGIQKRKISDAESIPAYNPPDDLPEHITELLDVRQPPAKGLYRAISDVLHGLQKRGEFNSTETVESVAEQFAIQIERAVHDEHPNHKEYGAQIRTLRFNLKENPDLCTRLLSSTLTPPMLATMTSDELASRELQRKTAKMKAQAERQSILGTEDGAPRLRRTHKGEELIEKDNTNVASEDNPPALRRQSNLESFDQGQKPHSHQADAGPRHGSRGSLHIETQQGSPRSGFDIKKVFSSVRSPVAPHQGRASQSQASFNGAGPGIDPEVDRLLQDDGDESPPYSPSDETDPDIVWRGSVSMNTVANFQATARHIGGVNLTATIGLPWSTLIPKSLTVAGRINEQVATEYLCSLRYSTPTDVTVASLSPATDAAKADFLSLIDYFTSRKRYGVIGEKGVGNVRDTYLVPVPAGTGSHPEFMLNLEDNYIPASRAAPMLLLVVVYRNDEAAMEKLRGPNWAGQYEAQLQAAAAAAATVVTPTPTPIGNAPRDLPAVTPVPVAATSAHDVPVRPTLQPVQPAHTAHAAHAAHVPAATTLPAADAHRMAPNVNAAGKENAQRDGEAIAKEVLGPLASCPTAVFLMSQAARMQKNEWILVRRVFENQPLARNDLQILKRELERYQEQHSAALPARTSQTPVPIPRVPHSAISPRSNQPSAPGAQPSAASPTS